MLYVKNLPVWERMLRFAGACILIAYAIFNFGGIISWVTIAAAIGLGLSAVLGFCPACAMVGRRLKKR